MCHRSQIADRIEVVTFDEIAQGMEIIQLVGAGERIVSIALARRQCESRLTNMFAPLGLDQSVERIIGIVADRIDLLVGIEDNLKRSILNSRDISDWIVEVVKVLYRSRVIEDLTADASCNRCGRRASCFYLSKAECLCVINRSSLSPIAINNQLALVSLVVVNPGDERRPHRLAILALPLQCDINRCK